MKTMSIHQPNFLPYLGFFDKMRDSDVFIVYDCAQYVERNFHQRNRIRILQESKWLTVPVQHPKHEDKTPIQEVMIRTDAMIKGVAWNDHMLKVIADNYKKAHYFEKFFPGLEEILKEPGVRLSELNTKLINYLARAFEIKTEVVSTKELTGGARGKDATEKIVNMCKEVNAEVYLSGAGGRNYMDESQFEKNGIKLNYQEYKHPLYPQQYGGFVPFMSSIDALFNIGRLPRSGERVDK